MTVLLSTKSKLEFLWRSTEVVLIFWETDKPEVCELSAPLKLPWTVEPIGYDRKNHEAKVMNTATTPTENIIRESGFGFEEPLGDATLQFMPFI